MQVFLRPGRLMDTSAVSLAHRTSKSKNLPGPWLSSGLPPPGIWPHSVYGGLPVVLDSSPPLPPALHLHHLPQRLSLPKCRAPGTERSGNSCGHIADSRQGRAWTAWTEEGGVLAWGRPY